MSDLHVRQIRAALDKTFRKLMDVSDLAEKPHDERENAFLSRSLAALGLAHLANISPEDAAAAVTDGYGDNGVDAVYSTQERRYFTSSSRSGVTTEEDQSTVVRSRNS
jgi:hypothetical protein